MSNNKLDMPVIENQDERDVWLSVYRNTLSMLFHSITEGKEMITLDVTEKKDIINVSSYLADKTLDEYKRRRRYET